MALKPPGTKRLDDPKAEAARREHEEKIRELQNRPSTGLGVVADIELEDGVERTVAHDLGRKPSWVKESCVRGAVTSGRVEEVRTGRLDRTRYVVLKATGWGATITVDLAVM